MAHRSVRDLTERFVLHLQAGVTTAAEARSRAVGMLERPNLDRPKAAA